MRKKQKELSLTEIAEIEDDSGLYEELDLFIWMNSKEDEEFDDNPTPILEYIAMWWLDSEVNNGGLNQYFSNYTGQGAHQALSGLKKIDATKKERILSEAIEILGGDSYPLDDQKRNEILESLSPQATERLELLTKEYYGDDQKIEDLIVRDFRKSPQKYEI